MTAVPIAVNVVSFNAVWLAAVGGAAAGWPWLGPLAALVLVLWHAHSATQPLRALGAVAAIGALGTLWDCVPIALGLIEYRGGAIAVGAAPYWILALWLAFATTLNVSLRWLRGRWVLAALLGAIAGPLCYRAGAALGALELVHTQAALLVQSAGWALLLPVAVVLAARLDGVSPLQALVTEPARV